MAGIETSSPRTSTGVRAILPEYAERCELLAAFGIPETIQHDDLHDGNVFVRDGRNLFFDWGDSCVSHPFHTLVVTLRGSPTSGSSARRSGHPPLPGRLPRGVRP